jgi:hypothetical protein
MQHRCPDLSPPSAGASGVGAEAARRSIPSSIGRWKRRMIDYQLQAGSRGAQDRSPSIPASIKEQRRLGFVITEFICWNWRHLLLNCNRAGRRGELRRREDGGQEAATASIDKNGSDKGHTVAARRWGFLCGAVDWARTIQKSWSFTSSQMGATGYGPRWRGHIFVPHRFNKCLMLLDLFWRIKNKHRPYISICYPIYNLLSV